MSNADRSPIALVLAISALVAMPARAAAQEATTPSTSVATGGSAIVSAAQGPQPARSRWFDTLELFVGPEGSKQPQDLGINANLGLRLSGNWGAPISRAAGLGLQVGVGVNMSDAAVRVLEQIEGTSRRTQTYLTLGLFQRHTGRMSWSLAYDMLVQQYYDDFRLAQWRGEVGMQTSPTTMVGTWFAVGARGEAGTMGGTAMRLDPVDQISGFFRQDWPSGAQTSVWAGVSGGHANIVWVLPDNSQSKRAFVYGAELHMPLSERLGVTGSANFLTPAATGTVDAFLGVVFYPGGGAAKARARAFAPLSAVANNPTFAVNLHR